MLFTSDYFVYVSEEALGNQVVSHKVGRRPLSDSHGHMVPLAIQRPEFYGFETTCGYGS